MQVVVVTSMRHRDRSTATSATGRVPKGARRQVLQIKWQLFGMAMFLLTEAWWALPASVANPSRR